MKTRKHHWVIAMLVALIALLPTFSSCGSLHSYWGVENDYYVGQDDHRHYHKPHKHKKYKKWKKHHKHHHHDHDDDD